MEEIYKELHKHNEDYIEEKRRARDYQAACFEKDKVLKEVLKWIEGDEAFMTDYPEEWEALVNQINKALEE